MSLENYVLWKALKWFPQNHDNSLRLIPIENFIFILYIYHLVAKYSTLMRVVVKDFIFRISPKSFVTIIWPLFHSSILVFIPISIPSMKSLLEVLAPHLVAKGPILTSIPRLRDLLFVSLSHSEVKYPLRPPSWTMFLNYLYSI